LSDIKEILYKVSQTSLLWFIKFYTHAFIENLYEKNQFFCRNISKISKYIFKIKTQKYRFKNQLTILSCEKVLKVFLSQVTNNEVSSAKHKSSIWNLVLFADPLNVIPIPGKNLSANRCCIPRCIINCLRK
jgi:hypothetical protein